MDLPIPEDLGGLAQDCADESSTNLLRTCSSITLQGCSRLLQHSSFVLRYKQGDKEYGSRPQISSRDNSICIPLTAISEIYPCIMVTCSVDILFHVHPQAVSDKDLYLSPRYKDPKSKLRKESCCTKDAFQCRPQSTGEKCL